MNNFLKLLGWGIAVVVVTAVASMSGRFAGKMSAEKIPHVSNQAPENKVIAVTIKQENPGVTEDTLDQKGLNELEAWVRQTLASKTLDGIISEDVKPESVDIKHDVDSAYVIKDGRKLAMFKFSTSINGSVVMTGVRLMGVDQNYVTWVSCIAEQANPIIIWSGTCGKEIEKELNVSMIKNP